MSATRAGLALGAGLAALSLGSAAALAQSQARSPTLAEEFLSPRHNFLPMPLSKPLALPQQEGPGVVVAAPSALDKIDTTGEAPLALAAAHDGTAAGDEATGEDAVAAIPEAFLRATRDGNPEPLRLAHYAYGAFQRGLYDTAFQVALRASAQDDPAAAALIGRLYEEAKGVSQDFAKAAGWYAVAADLGSAQAQNRLATMFLAGRGVPKDTAKAADVFERAAESGSADAAHALALLYLKGEGRTKNDDEAFRWMKTAAEQGDPRAQHALAVMYEEGQGTVPDDTAATRWYGRAAEAGDPSAALAYAMRRLRGIGASADPAAAAPFLRLAARAGKPEAMNLYARLLADGRGGRLDETEAVMWHLLARAAGVSDLYLDGFMGTRDPAVVEEARQRAAAFTGR